MEEQASWKGHTFTLMIFGGIVALCSIFFVLGMLVGRTQAQKIATADAAPKPAASKDALAMKDERPELTVERPQRPALEDIPAKPEPLPVTPAPVQKAAEPPPPPPPPQSQPAATGSSYQVSAMSKQADAEKLVNKLKSQGFPRAFMLMPASGDAKPVYRVQVGPIADPTEAESTRLKLVAAGYTPIKK